MISQSSTANNLTTASLASTDDIVNDDDGTTRVLKGPKSQEEMIVYLRHHAKDEEVKAALFKVKMGVLWESNYKSLQGVGRQVMAKTYAYLKDIKVEDDAITKLNVAGLRIMLLHRLLELMPELCRTCNKTNFFERTEVPMVRCSRCNKGACVECYPADISQCKSIHYLCHGCTKIVTESVGEKALDPKLHLLQNTKKKVKVIEIEQTKEDADESCVFLRDAEEGEEENVEENEEEKEETMQEKQEVVKTNKKTPGGDEGFRFQGKRGYLAGKDKICPHLRKGHCNFSLSGRKPYKGENLCPYKHPLTCPKLLNNGNKGRYGCDGTECGKFHPKMCPESLNLRQCQRDCRKGYHVRSNSKAMFEKKRQEEKVRKEEEERLKRNEEMRKKNSRTNFRNAKQGRQDKLDHPPFLQGFQPQGSQTPPPTFLEEVRREVLRVLREVLPVASSAPAPTQVLGGGPAYGLAWPPLQRR